MGGPLAVLLRVPERSDESPYLEGRDDSTGARIEAVASMGGIAIELSDRRD